MTFVKLVFFGAVAWLCLTAFAAAMLLGWMVVETVKAARARRQERLRRDVFDPIRRLRR